VAVGQMIAQVEEIFNADLVSIIRFLDIGIRVSQGAR
jgi:hypothetical protein